MAEGGGPIEDGSDILFEFECTPCAVDGSRVEALKFCQTCNQFLCDTCTKYHKRFTKGHQLVPAGSTKHQKPSTTKPGVPKCRIHPDRDIEMHCGTHDMVYCLLCIAKEHRSCDNVEEVQNGLHKSNPSKLQQLVDDIDIVNDQLHESKREKSRNAKMLNITKVNVLEEIDKLRKEMNDHFDHLERKIKADLEEEIANIEQAINDDIATADDLLITTNERKTDLTCNTDDKHTFIAEKLAQNDVSVVNAFLTKVNASKRVLQFERNTSLYDCIKTTDHLGKLVNSTTSLQIAKHSEFVVKTCRKRKVNVTDESLCCIVGMCQLQDGTIMCVDQTNSRLKRFDDQANVKYYCNLKSNPLGLCSFSQNQVVVRYKESMQFVHIGQSLSPGNEVKIKGHYDPVGNCIALCDRKLWTFWDLCVLVYSTSGELLKTIEIFSDDEAVSNYNRRLCGITACTHGNNVYVAAGGDGCYVINKNGDVIQKMRDQGIAGASAICVTEDGIVLVAGWYSNNVVMFDSFGNSLGELVSSKDMLSNPYALCFDKRKRRVLVSYRAVCIQIYEIKK